MTGHGPDAEPMAYPCCQPVPPDPDAALPDEQWAAARLARQSGPQPAAAAPGSPSHQGGAPAAQATDSRYEIPNDVSAEDIYEADGGDTLHNPESEAT